MLDWLVPAGFILVLGCFVPLGATFQFWPDEGYELMKALLVSRGHTLYSEIWNDQPPLHTVLLAALFQVTGPSVGVGRWLSLAFTALGLMALYRIVSVRSGRPAGLFAVALLISASGFLGLGVSVMLEVPAWSVALAAIWVASVPDPPGPGRGWRRAMLAGVLFACALQIKLTAALVGPALALTVVLARNSPDRSGPGERMSWIRRIPWHALLALGAGVALGFACWAWLFWQPGTIEQFRASHFSERTLAEAATRDSQWSPRTLANEMALAAAGGLGLLVGMVRRDRAVLVPVVMLLTAVAVHSWHRPYWAYYSVHFFIPMAWLGGVGLIEAWRCLIRADLRGSFWRKTVFALGLLVWCGVLSITLTLGGEQLYLEWRRLRSAPAAADNPYVQGLRANSEGAEWIFTRELSAAFHAGLAVPPELAVIPWKRLWSGQISPEDVRDALERHRPELILIPPDWTARFGLHEVIENDYRAQPFGWGNTLYRRLGSP
ncbi:MAG: glycosyltransferase family 39 protein [Verrucomicrobiae bacterium]|nr:glycosyltransferase family 39 protein [Verrucomicrobiae bacterium]